MDISSFVRVTSSSVTHSYESHSQIEEFQSFEPNYFFNLADFLCAFTSAFYLRFRDKDKMKGVSLCICTFLMCFGRSLDHFSSIGGSTMTNFVHGLMMGYLRRSTSFVSFLIGLFGLFLAFHQRFCTSSSPVCDWFSFPYLFVSGSFWQMFMLCSALTLLLTACFESTVSPRGVCIRRSLLEEAWSRPRSLPWRRAVAEECWRRFFSMIRRVCGWIS